MLTVMALFNHNIHSAVQNIRLFCHNAFAADIGEQVARSEIQPDIGGMK